MIITVASFKGGVGKTTTAVHLAAFLQLQKDTLLIDGDPNRSSTGWSKRGALPFRVIDERQAARFAGDYQNGHMVIDTAARPNQEDLEALAGGCDLLVIPATPDAMSLEALTLTVDALQKLASTRYRILLTKIPPSPSRDGEDAREELVNKLNYPLFTSSIRRISAFEKAALLGVPVHLVKDPRAKLGWQDYVAVGEEMMR